MDVHFYAVMTDARCLCRVPPQLHLSDEARKSFLRGRAREKFRLWRPMLLEFSGLNLGLAHV